MTGYLSKTSMILQKPNLNITWVSIQNKSNVEGWYWKKNLEIFFNKNSMLNNEIYIKKLKKNGLV